MSSIQAGAVLVEQVAKVAAADRPWRHVLQGTDRRGVADRVA